MPNFNKIKGPDGTDYTVEDTVAQSAASAAQSAATAAQAAADAAQEAADNITTAINGKGILSMSYSSENKEIVFTSTAIDIPDAAALTISTKTAAGIE